MLARVYIHNDMLAEAAAVYNALASRTSGYGGANIDLDRRLQLFELALMQVWVLLVAVACQRLCTHHGSMYFDDVHVW